MKAIGTNHLRKCSLFIVAVVLCFDLRVTAAETNSPGAFATGHYRNLFAEDGHSEKEIRAKVDSAFDQLFHGDPENQAIYFVAGDNTNGPLAYITDIKHKIHTHPS